MAKKRIKINKLEKFKWEFLRRNKDYIEFHNKYITCRKSKRYREKDNNTKIADFQVLWGVARPLNPAQSYEEILESLPAREKNIFFPFAVSLTLDPGYDKDCPLIWGEFMLDIQLPKRTITQKFEKYLDYYIKTFRNKAKKKHYFKNRSSLQNYQMYIDVYDLYKKGWNPEKIARKFYSRDVERDINYAKRKVKRDYERCRQLIYGEYRQIG